jgi:hypothetical protein
MTWKNFKKMVDELITMGKKAFDNFKVQWFHPNIYKRWHFRGYTIGAIALEVILAIISGGASLGLKVLSKIGKYFPKLKRILNKLLDLGDKLPGRRRKDRKDKDRDRDEDDKDRSEEERVFLAFKNKVNNALRPRRSRGISKNDLSEMVDRLRRFVKVRRAVLRTIIQNIGRRRLRYRIRAIVRGSARPREIGKVKRLPTGTRNSEAIPFTWFKPKSIYQRSIPLVAKDPQSRVTWDNPPPSHPSEATRDNLTELPVPRRQRILRIGRLSGRTNARIGVTPNFFPRPGKVMKRTRASTPGLRGNAVGALRTLLRNYSYDTALRNEQVDHIQDLAYSGQDTFQNLWPLDGTLNQRAKNRTNQSQRVTYQENNEEKTNVPNRMIGKWFRMKKIRRP